MHRHRVLVVEDEKLTRQALAGGLRSADCAVSEARDADEAFARLHAGFCPCVILLDIRLPRKNGWQFRLEQLTDARLAGIPLVVCSGDAVAVQEARLFGVRDVVMKPIDLPELLARLDASCRNTARANAACPENGAEVIETRVGRRVRRLRRVLRSDQHRLGR